MVCHDQGSSKFSPVGKCKHSNNTLNTSSSLQIGSDNSYGEGLEEHNGQSTTDVDSGADDESDSELGIINKYESQYSVSTA